MTRLFITGALLAAAAAILINPLLGAGLVIGQALGISAGLVFKKQTALLSDKTAVLFIAVSLAKYAVLGIILYLTMRWDQQAFVGACFGLIAMKFCCLREFSSKTGGKK